MSVPFTMYICVFACLSAYLLNWSLLYIILGNPTQNCFCDNIVHKIIPSFPWVPILISGSIAKYLSERSIFLTKCRRVKRITYFISNKFSHKYEGFWHKHNWAKWPKVYKLQLDLLKPWHSQIERADNWTRVREPNY
jgi:hypothetical protein